jgi:hypothetical protein
MAIPDLTRLPESLWVFTLVLPLHCRHLGQARFFMKRFAVAFGFNLLLREMVAILAGSVAARRRPQSIESDEV